MDMQLQTHDIMIVSLCCTHISHLVNGLLAQARCEMTFNTKENVGHVPSYSEQILNPSVLFKIHYYEC